MREIRSSGRLRDEEGKGESEFKMNKMILCKASKASAWIARILHITFQFEVVS